MLLLSSAATAADLSSSSKKYASPASAGTGFYVGVGAGLDVQTLSEDGSPLTISADAYVMRARFGYDLAPLSAMGMPSIVFGIIGDVSYSTVEKFDVSAAWSGDILVRAGIPLGGTLLYAGGGGVWKEFDVPSVSYSPSGWAAIGGLQADLGNGFAVQIEGRREWADDKVAGDKIENTSDSVTVFLVKKF
jgi:opacity protein-like surface antigen